MEKNYRPAVGICLFNEDGKVFVAERIDMPGGWQMPQGGLDDDVDVRVAAFRELREEIGTDKATIIRIHGEKLKYDIPQVILDGLPWGRKYQGQLQTWVAMKFNGTDADIKLDADEHPEFQSFQWVSLEQTVELIVPFKKDLYKQIVEAFKDLAP